MLQQAQKLQLLLLSNIPSLPKLVQSHKLSTHLNLLIPSTDNEIKKFLPQCDIILADPALMASKEYIELANTRCKWLQSTWAGVDSLTRLTNVVPKFQITKFAGYFGKHMAEYTLQHILNHERHFKHLMSLQKDAKWEKESYSYRTLDKLTLGIMGFGDIGKHVCKVAKFFNMRVHVLKKTKSTESIADKFFYVDEKEQFEQFLSTADYLLNTLPSTKHTKGLLSGEVLKNCKKGSVFINVGRGDVIDENSLLNALKNGWISAAVLDVFEEEPLPKTSQIWRAPNVTITPHVSAMSFADEVCEAFFDNLKLFLDKKPLKYTVNWERGY